LKVFATRQSPGWRVSFPAEKALFWALLLLLVWLPILLRQQSRLGWTIMEITAYVLAASWIVLLGLRPREPMRTAEARLAALALLAAVALLHVFQMDSSPRSWVESLSPEAARMHALADMVRTSERWITISVDPHATKVALLKTIAYTALFFLVLAL
jgi:hypothetical protein